MSLRISMLFTVVLLFTACKKYNIAPENQDDAFVKYYGYVNNQSTQDVIPAVDGDGGYLVLGSSTSFTPGGLKDYYLVRTDSLGNQVWSHHFGGGGNEHSETAKVIVPLPDSTGYLVAGNRTKIESIGGQTTDGQTLIVVYQLGLEGEIVWEKVIEGDNAGFTASDFVADMKIASNGDFIIVGETTDVYTQKNGYRNYMQWDLTDILIARYTAEGAEVFRERRGFLGKDKAVDLELVGDEYCLVTTTNQKKPNSGTPSNPDFTNAVGVYQFRQDNGGEVAVNTYGGNRFTQGDAACYDAENEHLIVLAHVEDNGITGSNGNDREGELFIVRVDASISGDLQAIPPTNGGNSADGYYFYGGSDAKLQNIKGNLEGADIELLEPLTQTDTKSFIISATCITSRPSGNSQSNSLKGSQSVLIRLDENLQLTWESARLFGRGGDNASLFPGNRASSVIPVLELVAGTTRKELKGYLMGATFDLGTNTLMGLVKTNVNGTMTPVDD